MQKADVAILMGSASDESAVAPCAELLRQFAVPFVFTITSAHRTPERTAKLVEELETAGCKVFICAAGMAAHLAGAVAARTIRPVIGIPVTASALAGMDALFSTVQMPPGFPVATVALDKAGAKNAAWLALQILALNDPALAATLHSERKKFRDTIESAANDLQRRYLDLAAK